MPEITIYTDGSALGNTGPGGYGAVLISGRFRKEVSQGYRLTTNNRMELLAVCVALEMLKFEGSDVTIYSDSKYVVDAVEKRWVFGWEKKGFAGKKNPDLWSRFLRSYRRHKVRFVWVKGHASWSQPTTGRTCWKIPGMFRAVESKPYKENKKPRNTTKCPETF